jgi:shikimate kinase
MLNTENPTISFMPPKSIVLVGLMGCGKTSVGKRLAKRLELDFFDSDQELELAAGCSIKDFFKFYSEEEFREGEYRVIKRLLSKNTHILATGGGSFMDEKTRDLVKEHAISVWLKADLPTLVARVSRRSDRPLLDSNNSQDILQRLIEERYPLYEHANIHVDTIDEPTNETVTRVIKMMSNYVKDNYPNYYVLKTI